MAEFRASFTYTPALARRAYLALMWEMCSVFVVISPIVAVWALLFLGSREYAPLAGIAVGALAMLWGSWGASYRLVGLIAAGSPRVELVLAEDGCTFRSPDAEAAVRWSGIAQVYRLKRFWVFSRKGIPYASVVPAELLSAEARAFVEAKMRNAGGKLR